MTRPRIGGSTLATLAVLALGGCSALQIDVDVYKGPLASQREVQLRQFASIAIAAKPLLADLRNESEEKADPQFKGKLEGRQLEGFYDYKFVDPVAKFTNGVLNFYDDVSDGVISPEAESTLRYSERFEAALKMFEVQEGDCELANAIERAPRQSNEPKDLESYRQALLFFIRAGSVTKGDWQSRACGQSDLPRDPKITRKVEDVERALLTLCAPSSGQRYLDATVSAPLRQRICDDARRPGPSMAFHRLADAEVARAHAAAIYGSLSPDAKHLAGRLQEIGASFVAARQEMSQLFSASLRLFRSTAERGSREQLETAATVLVNATQPRTLSCYLNDHPKSPFLSDRLRAALAGDQWPLTSWSFTGDQYGSANRLLRSAALAYPNDIATLLEGVDTELRAGALGDPSRPISCQPYVQSDFPGSSAADSAFSARRYGLSRGTQVDNSFDDQLRAVSQKLQYIVFGNTNGFDRARTALGIETLTNRYLKAVEANRDDVNRREVAESRRQLEEMLIMFAERVLYVVNNRNLLEQGGSGSGYVTSAGFTRRAVILQTVGNTIIVLVDDLRRQADYDKGLRDRYEPELRAVKQAFQMNPAQTYDELSREVTATISRETAESIRLNDERKRSDKAFEAASKALTDLKADSDKKEQQSQDASSRLADLVEAARPTLAAYRTFIAAEKGTSWAKVAPADKDAPKDRGDTKAAVGKLGPKTNGAKAKAELSNWIYSSITAAAADTSSSAKLTRLDQARSYLESKGTAFDDIAEGPPAAVLKEISTRIEKDFLKQDEPFMKLSAEAALASNAASATKAVFDTRQAQATKTQGRVSLLDSAIATSASVADQQKQTLTILQGARSEVLAKAETGRIQDGRGLQKLLKETLQTKAEAAQDPDKKRIQAAIQFVDRTTPMTPISFGERVTASRTTKSQRDVLDDLIAQLRQQRVEATANGQPERAANIEKALALSYEQRSGMAYLRPASAYLRNIYSATAVQANPEVGWINMLNRNTKRLFDFPDEARAAELATRQGIEKQFWQTINTIELSSAAAANYVVVKDDVGNWYVKAYSSDPSSIIRSAQSLALFNIGKKIDVNLLRRVELQRRVDDTQLGDGERDRARADLSALNPSGAPASSGASTTGLKKVQQRYADGYAKQTIADVAALSNRLTDFKTSLRTAWERDLEGDSKAKTLEKLESYVSADTDEVKSALTLLAEADKTADTERPARSADAIIDSLRQVRRLRARLEPAIAKQGDLVASQEATLKSAQATLDTQVATLKSRESDLAAKKTVEGAAVGDAALKAAQAATSEAAASVAAAKEEADGATKARDEALTARQNAEANRTKAARTVRTLADQLVTLYATKRIDTVKQWETAIGFIGEVATEK